MVINIPPKFSEQQIDEFVNNIYSNYLKYPTDNYLFDLSKTEWVSNQSLVVLTCIFRYFNSKQIKFDLIFFDEEVKVSNIPRRVALQIVQLWEIYEIWKVLPEEKIFDYHSYYSTKINKLKIYFDIKIQKPIAYQRYEITPILQLENIKNYKDNDIEELMKRYCSLNTATAEIVYKNKCEHPFVNEVLGSIMSKELYENFLDHHENNFFDAKDNFAFMSLKLKGKLDEEEFDDNIIQYELKTNFEKEAIPETKDFFYDDKLNKFRNEAYLQYSFLDFGVGIVNTLREQYLKKHNLNNDSKVNENDILKFAFKHDSSRYPIYDRFGQEDNYIPRGLFDVLCMVKRYQGLLVVRSNYGKILYDFSNNKNFDQAFLIFGNNSLFFPGTFISIYLPAIPLGKLIDESVIKPIFEQSDYSAAKKKYIDLYQIIRNLNNNGKDLYTNLIKELYEIVNNHSQKTLIYFSFRGCDLDVRLTKKLIYFLLTNYDFNTHNNIIVVNPPKEKVLNEINEEIINLSTVIKNYKIHPLPFIYYNPGNEKEPLILQWLGVFNNEDKVKLNELLFEQFSLAKSDFIEPDGIVGHMNYFDQYGNLKSNLPNRQQIIQYYEEEYIISDENTVKRLIVKNQCLIKRNDKNIYLTNGNYYQYEFLNLINLLEKKEDCDIISKIIYNRLAELLNPNCHYKYIAIASSSHKILFSLVNQKFIQADDVISLDNFYAPSSQDKLNEVSSEFSYILVCDVIATGFKTENLIGKIKEKEAELEFIAVIANTIDPNFESSQNFIEKYKNKLVSLYNYKIEKHRRNEEEIKTDIQTKQVIRINPFTNIPITLSIEKTNTDSILIKDNVKFLNLIKEDQIKVGYGKYNNLIHPYFFDTRDIIKNNGGQILTEIFKHISELETSQLKIFFPKGSGIKLLNFKEFKNNILQDHSVEEYELERFNTLEGWKFPHTTDYFKEIIANRQILILDDGSCSGDSIIQMINQLSFYKPKQIIVISIIGRVNDHKREFFSLISEIKKEIKLKILFGSYWHIPTYYIDNNPNTRERNWLYEIIGLQNTPVGIKKIATVILKEIEPKNICEIKDYKYLPRRRNSENEIPKKELINIRDEIGKVIGYRYYKESFIFFDEFIKKYEGDIYSKDRYKEIELLCAAITYEPYLYAYIKQILPDIVDKLKEFTQSILFGNPNRGNKLLELNNLYYNWDRKDIVHLFFILFEDKDLDKELRKTDNFIRLVDFLDPRGKSINYILYKLLNYIPINKNEISKKNNDELIKELLYDLENNNKSYRTNLKRFNSFLATLPSKDDLISQINKLRDIYLKQKSEQLHDSKATVNHSISLLISKLRSGIDEVKRYNIIKDETLRTCQYLWTNIADFLSPILSFSKGHREYLEPVSYDKFNNLIDDELRKQISLIEEVLFNENMNLITSNKLKIVMKMIAKIQLNFGIDSELNKLFEFPRTNFKSFVKTFFNQIKEVHPNVTVVKYESINDNLNFKIPLLYAELLIIKETCTNLKNYSNLDKVCRIHLIKTDNSYRIEITNDILQRKNNSGGGEGIRCLKNLSDSHLFDFKYKYKIVNSDIFEQNFIF